VKQKWTESGVAIRCQRALSGIYRVYMYMHKYAYETVAPYFCVFLLTPMSVCVCMCGSVGVL